MGEADSLPRSLGDKETGRIEAFSDAVIAIAITLLVLNIKIPTGLSALGLESALIADWPTYFAFVVGFATIGIMWINHHRLFTLIHKSDNKLLVFNTILLFAIAAVPFFTALLASYLTLGGARIAVIIYIAWSIFLAVAFNLVWRYASSPKHNLLRISTDSKQVKAINRQYRFGPAWYAIALVAAFFSALLGILICAGLAIFFLFPPKEY